MSRAFSPPDTLTQENRRTVADVRRTVWINGLFGLGAGSVTGMLGHIVLQTLQRRYVGDGSAPSTSATPSSTSWIYRCLRPLPPLGRNTFLLSFLSGGALGSFVMSTTAGKNAAHLLHPIFEVGKDENAGKSPYQIALQKAQKQQAGDQSDQQLNSHAIEGIDKHNKTQIEEDELDAAHHRARSLRRAASVKRRLESGHSLSDTHGNTWPYTTETDQSGEEFEQQKKDRAVHRAEAWGRRQTLRREWVQERIEKGKALSDSTGGHWAESKEEEET